MIVTARCLLLAIFVSLATSPVTAQDRKTKVLNDRDAFAKNDVWVYNDLAEGFAEAEKTGKPLLVVLRCIPCEACSHFDKQLLDEQENMRDLLDQFVCVRIVQANGLDLNLFQFDYDQSFHAVFLQNSKTIYGRYGTRSEKLEDEDMTVAGFRQAMRRVLEIHTFAPEKKAAFAAKRGGPVPFAIPEQLPSLKGKYQGKIDYEGNVVQSCIHCHQIRDSERLIYRDENREMPEQVLFPYPLPQVIGLTMNPNECATVKAVAPDSAAATTLEVGDEILEINSQPIVSTADIQWILHNAVTEAELKLTFRRDKKVRTATLTLPRGWRRKSDLSWRPTTWELRRIAAGGLQLVDLTDAERKSRQMPADSLALRVKHAGEYGEHAVAKNAGFRKDDVLVQVDGGAERWSETDFLAASIAKPRGKKLAVTVLRGTERLKLMLPIQ